MRHLIDGDPASNTLSWRWVAGLHTRGKPYAARAENIRRYTDGRYDPAGLNEDPVALEEPDPPSARALPPGDAPPADDVALLLHLDDLNPREPAARPCPCCARGRPAGPCRGRGGPGRPGRPGRDGGRAGPGGGAFRLPGRAGGGGMGGGPARGDRLGAGWPLGRRTAASAPHPARLGRRGLATGDARLLPGEGGDPAILQAVASPEAAWR